MLLFEGRVGIGRLGWTASVKGWLGWCRIVVIAGDDARQRHRVGGPSRHLSFVSGCDRSLTGTFSDLLHLWLLHAVCRLHRQRRSSSIGRIEFWRQWRL